ncbi:MAG: transcriptional regulator MarR family [Frankiales bacterium]|nr:transcriptional regulator MarR family [Frankiales bacterium]
MTRWLSSDEQRAWRAFLQASALVRDRLDAELQRDADMPHGYYEILVRLSEAEGGSLRMSHLAKTTGSSRSRLSHAVSALEARGWVRREATDSDRRGQVAVLTALGMSVLEQAAPGHVEEVRRVLFDPLTDEQVVQLRTLFEAVLAQDAAGVPAEPTQT